MPLWLRFFQVGPEHAVLLTMALPLALTIFKVWRQVHNGADHLTPSLHFLIALGATLAAGMSRPFQFSHGIEPPLSDIPLYIFGAITLWLAPKAARTWYKKPEAKKKKKLPLPDIVVDRALSFLPMPAMLRPGAQGGAAGGQAGPKLQRVRAGRLDFRVLWAMIGCGAFGLVSGGFWLSGDLNLDLGFVLLVLCGGALILLSRRIYRDTFLVAETDEKEEDKEDEEGFGLELPQGMGGKTPLPAPLPRPAPLPKPAPSPQPAPPSPPAQLSEPERVRFGKRRG